MSETGSDRAREPALCYPNTVWFYGDWMKNLILFVDGIAPLVPDYSTKATRATRDHLTGDRG